ncbi:cell wall-binding repeat-containing protein [Miniphocaeibacter massiliensis]|uniref:cell wall-binding repeat-containing protein n=1 Tax=Miniphocaeibacter massiliensis TaxID=2041841 RepID=UPI000C06DF8D|nr:cell wall-binding repeat-containing protein [Miniphocaeibacter massiliensis]
MNKTKERIITIILLISLLLSVFIGVVTSSKVSYAEDNKMLNISDTKIVKGNSTYINSISGDNITEGSKLIFEDGNGNNKEFTAELNEDTGFYYFKLKFDEVGTWKLIESSLSEVNHEEVIVYNSLEEMTGRKDGYIDISGIDNTSIEGKNLEYSLTKIKGYNNLGNYVEVKATISDDNNSGEFFIFNDGFSSTISVPENYTLNSGNYKVNLEVQGYSTSIDITLKSTYTTVVEDVVEKKQVTRSTMSASTTSTSSTLFERYQGANRYSTAVKVSKSKYTPKGSGKGTEAKAVVLVNGNSPSDMSVAAAFAKQKSAPILLVQKDSLTSDTLNEIKRLKVKDIYIIGGKAVISEKVEKELKNNGISAKKRFAGKDAYDTSVLVSKDLISITNRGTVIIMSGTSYYDSLSAASLSASKAYPVLCVSKNSMTSGVKSAIKSAGYKDAIIIGGDATISEKVKKEVDTVIKSKKSSRVFGADRYGTSMAIAKKYFPNTKIINIATGTTYADALPGAAVAGVNDSPIIVVEGNTVSSNLKTYINGIKELKGVYIFGGTAAVSAKFETNLRNIVFSTSTGGGSGSGGVSKVSILLDPGHGAGSTHNRGYVGPKWKNEGDGNYYFSLLLKKELEAYGIKVGTTRSSISANPDLAPRGEAAKGYNLFISLHTNAGGGTGVEIYNDVQRTGAEKLASNLTSNISSTLNITNRGVKKRLYGENTSGVNPNHNYYGVLRNNGATAGMLIEHCFHDNYTEIKKYEDRATTLAKNMASEIAKYYGLK